MSLMRLNELYDLLRIKIKFNWGSNLTVSSIDTKK